MANEQHRDFLRVSEELTKAREELKNSHENLIQNEKMASLGILSAGVAHEINNPVGYILSNITTLAEYLPQIDSCVQPLLGLLSEVDQDNPLYTRRLAVERLIQEHELNYLLNDTKDLVEETREGAVRVLDIVKGLKIFAHAGDDAMVEADINECLLSTLSLVNNNLKYHCEIKTSLGEVPLIRCSFSKLGQVFMNILVNAGHAITENGIINISTIATDGNVIVRIEDNGCGMSEQVRKSIFKPFFTTKEKGLGTGLGLAISRGIIEEHGGKIRVDSVPNTGTTFYISLPISTITDDRDV